MAHKQDRHNCSILLNLKLYLSNVNYWKVFITGSHVPPDGEVVWCPPPPSKQRLDEDMRDLIVAHADRANTSDIVDILSKKNKAPKEKSTKKRISYFVSSMKKRRRERDYNYADTVRKRREEDGDDDGLGGEMGRTTEGHLMQQIRLAGPGAENMNTAKQEASMAATQVPCIATTSSMGRVLPCPTSSGGRMILTDNQGVVLVQSDDPGSDLLTLCEMMDTSMGVIEIQTTSNGEQLQHQQIHEHQQQQNKELDLNSSNDNTDVRSSLVFPPSSQASGISLRSRDASAGLQIQDVTNLNDLGALLLAANQQK